MVHSTLQNMEFVSSTYTSPQGKPAFFLLLQSRKQHSLPKINIWMILEEISQHIYLVTCSSYWQMNSQVTPALQTAQLKWNNPVLLYS